MKYPEDFINQIIHGDCLEVLKEIPDNSIDAVVTDPPYALGFMGKEWDTFDKSQFGRKGLEGKNDLKVKKNFEILPRYKNWDGYYEFSFNWSKEVFRVLKPGGHLLAFGGTRTYHRMTCGIEDAGFEIRDCIMYIFGSGFPKSLNIAKSIDRLLKEGTASLNSVGDNSKGALYFHKLNFEQGYRPKDYTNVERRKYEITEDIAKKWEGWGTALKPAYEPIVVARKPLSEKNVALNVLKWGTGGLNIDEGRIKTNEELGRKQKAGYKHFKFAGSKIVDKDRFQDGHPKGRFPANVIWGCICDEVIERKEEIVKIHDAPKGTFAGSEPNRGSIKNYRERNVGKSIIHTNPQCVCYMLDKQSGINASRFFYCAKASKKERLGLDKIEIILYKEEDILCKEKNLTQEEKLVQLQVDMDILPPKVIVEYGTQNKSVLEWSISWFGKNLMEKYQKDFASIILTETNLTMTSKIYNWLVFLLTKEYTADVNLLTENGGNLVENVDNLKELTISINEKMASRLGVKSAVSKTLLKISVKEKKIAHPTQKPLKLMEYLVKLVTPPGGLVLDPFAGSGTTCIACKKLGFRFIGIEKEPEYVEIARARLEAIERGSTGKGW